VDCRIDGVWLPLTSLAADPTPAATHPATGDRTMKKLSSNGCIILM